MTDIKPSTEIGPTEARDMLTNYVYLEGTPGAKSEARMSEERLISLICAGSRTLPEPKTHGCAYCDVALEPRDGTTPEHYCIECGPHGPNGDETRTDTGEHWSEES